MIGSKVDGDKCNPNDARAVHSEGDVLGLVEVLWNLPGLESVHGTEDDEEDVVEKGNNGSHLASTAF